MDVEICWDDEPGEWAETDEARIDWPALAEAGARIVVLDDAVDDDDAQWLRGR